MQLKEITNKEHEKYLLTITNGNFLQSSKMENVYKNSGWNIKYVGLFDKKNIVGTTLLLYKKNKFGKNYFYSPRGLIVDYNNENIVKNFIKELKEYIKSNNGYVLKFDPNIPTLERDMYGEIVEDGFNNNYIINLLKTCGCKHYPAKRGTDMSRQVSWVFELDLKDKTQEEIFSNFNPLKKRSIKKLDKYPVDIIEVTYDDLDKFKVITEYTSKRLGFSDKSLSYYQNMYKAFSKSDEVKFLIAEVDLAKHLDILKNELDTNLKKLDKTLDTEDKKGIRNQLKDTIESLNKRITAINELMKEHGERLKLSSSMFMLFNKEITYLFSGNYDEYMSFNGQYAIQWYMIKYALEHGFTKYNFYGISGVFDKSDPEYGVYEFKRGFNGNVVEYLGEFDIVVDSFMYNLLNLKNKLFK